MKRIVVRLSGMPFDPTYEIDDDTVAIGDLVRVPGSNSALIDDGEPGTVIALESSYTVAMQACHPSQVTAYRQELPTVFTSLASRLRGEANSWSRYVPLDLLSSGPGRAAVTRRGVQPGGVNWTA